MINSRRLALANFEQQQFDLLIIGGGITGAGVARDAASRGMKVALVEAQDFAQGTSSRSSKLIHGGIRYLENLEFGLVFEALSERQKLFEIAPHLVHPLKFLIPIYKTGRVPAWKMGLGMWVYDALSLFEAPEMHQYLNPLELHSAYPTLQTNNLSGGFTYYDAYMDDDRLVHETLRSAQSLGAQVANFVAAERAIFSSTAKGEKVTAIEVVDHESRRRFKIHAQHIISTVGPWTDLLGQDLLGQGQNQWRKKLRPSKGVHLTFSRERFDLQDAVVMGAESRIVFAIPRNEMVIVGTTDTDFPGDPSSVRVEREDVRYLLSVIEQYFPGARIGRKDIVGAYAGVRPLIDDGADSESKTSREHEIWTDPSGITFVAGGKYTTYRLMAQQTVEKALLEFSFEEQARFSKASTLSALNPKVTPELLSRAQTEAPSLAKELDLPADMVMSLAKRHGYELEDLLNSALGDSALAKPREAYSEDELMWLIELDHAVKTTMCLHLKDFFFRRTQLVLTRPDHGFSLAKVLAEHMGKLLGWTQQKMNDEINALQNQLDWEFSLD